MSFGERADRLDWLVQERELDLLLVSALSNVRYLTGYPGTNGLCVAGSGARVFLTDFRYTEMAKRDIVDWNVREGKRDLFESVVESATAKGEDLRLGFDDAHLSVKQHLRLAGLVPDGIELVPASGLVEQLREVKDASELDAISGATAFADEIYRWLIEDFGLAGRTEREVALAIQTRALANGADGISFPPIVAAAENGAIGHAEPRDVAIPKDTLVVVDMGCMLDAYCSDCTRTFATGEIGEEATEVYELVRAAQQASLDRIKAGVSGAEVDAAARDLIDAAGHGARFGHGTGHGVGLEVHEGPRVAPKADNKLAANNVVTVEPGVYLPGKFGVRIEDLVVVTDDSCEILTTIDKSLTVI